MAVVILKNVRIVFPQLFVAKQYKGAGAFSYSATFLVDPKSDNHKVMLAAIIEVAKAAWSDKYEPVLKSIKDNNQKICYYLGDTKEYDGFTGNYALSAKRYQDDGHPKVIDQKLNDLSPADGKPYGGCFVNAKLDIWAQDNDWGKGIRATLITVQMLKDGDAFSNVPRPSSEGFKEEEVSDDAGVENLI